MCWSWRVFVADWFSPIFPCQPLSKQPHIYQALKLQERQQWIWLTGLSTPKRLSKIEQKWEVWFNGHGMIDVWSLSVVSGKLCYSQVMTLKKISFWVLAAEHILLGIKVILFLFGGANACPSASWLWPLVLVRLQCLVWLWCWDLCSFLVLRASCSFLLLSSCLYRGPHHSRINLFMTKF